MPGTSASSTRFELNREVVIAVVLGALLLGLLAFGAITQPPRYHDLADQRPLYGIPHFWNLASNVPFLIVGAMGMHLLLRRPPGASTAWAAVFGGTLLTGLGSAYYHLDPSDATLVWDRLPIGVAFMGFLVALLSEHMAGNGRRLARHMLLPLVLLSIGTVYWWRVSGDLAPWVWVQLAPMLAVLLALAFLPGQYTHRRYFAYALAFYATAKLFELGDQEVMQWSGDWLSGHSLKHLAATAGVYCLYTMLKKRTTR